MQCLGLTLSSALARIQKASDTCVFIEDNGDRACREEFQGHVALGLSVFRLGIAFIQLRLQFLRGLIFELPGSRRLLTCAAIAKGSNPLLEFESCWGAALVRAGLDGWGDMLMGGTAEMIGLLVAADDDFSA